MTGDEVARLEQELARHRRLAEASYALHTTLDLDALLNLILDAAKAGVGADRGTVFLLTEDGRELWSKVATGDRSLEIRLPAGHGIAGSVAATGETLNSSDAYADPRFDRSWDERSGYRTRRLLTAPIRNREGAIVGVFQLLNKAAGDFDAADEAFLASLSIHAALAVENARLHRAALEKERQDREIELVRNVQRAYQPEESGTALGCLVAAGLNQLCEDASGDYYDFIELPSGRLGVVCGDVSGHGLGAALVMAQARALVRAFAATVDDLADVMNLMNDFLARDMSSGRFMTLFVALADPQTGALEWNNAGHPPGLLYRAASGAVERLPSQGRVLGVFPGAGFTDAPGVVLDVGDVLLLYTDGATEAADPEGRFLGEDGLAEVLLGLAGRDPAGILAGVRAALEAWTGRPAFQDDLTLVVLQRQAAGAGS
jgi:sigma-B regulation protein RsbU (phosphoserine phosphatase)